MRRLARKQIVSDLKRSIRTHDPRFHRFERRAGKVGCKDPLYRVHILRRLQEVGTPLSEEGRDLVVILLCDEIIETRPCIKEQGIQGRLHSIARMQMVFGL